MAGPRGRRDAPSVQILSFHAVFGQKNVQNNRLAYPPRKLAHTPPPLPHGDISWIHHWHDGETLDCALFPALSSQIYVTAYFSYLCMFLIGFRLLVSGGFLLVITFLVPGRIYCRFISIVVGFSWNSCFSHFQLFCVVYFIYSFYTSRLCTQPKLFLALNIFFYISFSLSVFHFCFSGT